MSAAASDMRRAHVWGQMAGAAFPWTEKDTIADARFAVQTGGVEAYGPGLCRMRAGDRAVWLRFARGAPAGELSPNEIDALASCGVTS